MNISIPGTPLFGALIAMIALVLALIFLMKSVYSRRSAKRLTERNGDELETVPWSDRNKYPGANVFRLSGTFFNLGMALALAVTVMAFNWTQYERDVYIPQEIMTLDYDIEIEPPRTVDPPVLLPPPPPVIEEVPNEDILEADEPEFVDQSVEENTAVLPPPVMERKPAASNPLPLPPQPEAPEIEEIFRVVEEMPRFPGCEDLGSAAERKQCADRKMLEFIYRNIKYPSIARENGVEGTVVITFVVEKNGEVSDARIIRDVGAQLGQEALRVVNLMNEQGLKWTPGKQRGLPVRVQFSLPVRFRLE